MSWLTWYQFNMSCELNMAESAQNSTSPHWWKQTLAQTALVYTCMQLCWKGRKTPTVVLFFGIWYHPSKRFTMPWRRSRSHHMTLFPAPTSAIWVTLLIQDIVWYKPSILIIVLWSSCFSLIESWHNMHPYSWTRRDTICHILISTYRSLWMAADMFKCFQCLKTLCVANFV